MRPFLVLATCLAVLGLAACGTVSNSIRQGWDSRKAVIDRSLLSAAPCVNDAIRTTFGLSPKAVGSYADPQAVSRSHIKQRFIVRLDPSESKTPAVDARTLRYEIYNLGDSSTGITYNVDLEGALREEWLEQAFQPLAQCGARQVK